MTLPVIYRPTPSGTATDVTVALDGWQASTNPADVADAQGTEWWCTSIDGWNGTPDLRLYGQDRPQDHGQFDNPSYYGSRVVTIAGTAICTDKTAALLAQDIISSVAAWDTTQLYTMQVSEPGRPTRRADVRLNAATKVGDFNGTSFSWQLQVRSPDPRRYDDIETVITLSPPTGAVGGVTVPLTVPFTLDTTGLSTSSATAVNAGTIACRPVVVLNGPLVDPQIANVTSMRSLSLILTIASGDYVVLDFDRRTVLLNGAASRSSALTSTAAWWELPPGGNDLQFTAGGGDGTAVVRYRSASL